MYAEELKSTTHAKPSELARLKAENKELDGQVAFMMEANRNTRAVAGHLVEVLQRVNAAAEELMEHMAVSDADDRTRLLVENLKRALDAE